MDVLIYGLAGVGLLVALAVVYLWWKFWRPMRKALKVAKQAYGVDSLKDLADSPEMNFADEIPSENELIWAMKSAHWQNEEAVGARIAEFEALGFTRLGVFSGYAGIMPMELMLHSGGVVAMVGEDDEGERSRCKVFGLAATGAPVIVSDRTDACAVVQLPGEVRVYREGQTASELCAAFSEALASTGQTLYPLKSDTLIQNLEDLQRRRAFYLVSNPQVMEPWIRERSDDDKKFRYLESCLKQSVGQCATECCRAQFAQESGMSAANWERLRERLVFVHDGCFATDFEFMEVDEEIGALGFADADRVDLNEVMGTVVAPIDRTTFAQRNAELPPHVQMRPLAQLRQPVEADVYLRP